MRYLLGLFAATLFAAAPALGWEHWGGDRGGTRFSPLAQITPAKVDNLVRAWDFRTGDLPARLPAVMARTKSEATPLFVEDSLIFCSPFNEVIALDPGSGARRRAVLEQGDRFYAGADGDCAMALAPPAKTAASRHLRD